MPVRRSLRGIVLTFAAIGPTVAIAAFLRATASRHLVLTIAGLAAWELLLLAGAFLGQVYGKLQARWVDAAAESIDGVLRRTLSGYSRHYRYLLSRLHHDIDLCGLSTWGMHALPMDEVFVDLSLVPQSPHRIPGGLVADSHGADGGGAPAEPGSAAGPAAGRGAPLTDGAARRSVWEMLERYPGTPLAILGPPGSGKTTLLRHVTLALCSRQQHRRMPRQWRTKLPVLLYLREHVASITGDPGLTLANVARRTLSGMIKTEPPEWLERQLRAGRCVVMLDGLDEVARRYDRTVMMRWVRDQITRYPRCRFVLTSRPFGFMDPPLIAATVVQVRQFSDAQVEAFVRSWYLAVERRSARRDDVGVHSRADEGAERLLSRLYSSPPLLALATNPHLLTMIASVHRYRAALPGSRAELYREICQVFLGKRLEAKALASELSIDQKTIVLAHLAFAMMDSRVRDIPADEAAARIAPTLEKVSFPGSPADFLALIERTTGLLIEREGGIYAFAHLTFQEYLAALHVAQAEPVGYLIGKICDSWWREVILLWAANADATHIIQAALQVDPPTIELLSLAADCADHAREVSSHTRGQLSRALSARPGGDCARWRLVAQVRLRRKLSHVIRSKSAMSAFICEEPVTNAEYRLFLRDLGSAAADCRPDGWSALTPAAENLPLAGISPGAAIMFADWARSLGLDVQLPETGALSAAEYGHIATPPAMRFWTRTGRDQDEAFALSPQVAGPYDPEFRELLLHQMSLDTRLLRRVPTEKRAAIGMSAVDGASVDAETLGRLAAGLGASGPGYRSELAAFAARQLQAVAEEQIFTELPTRLSESSLPDEYRARLASLTALLAEEWDAGAHWPEAARLGRSRSDADVLTVAPGQSWRSQLIRAYCRLVYWYDTQMKETPPLPPRLQTRARSQRQSGRGDEGMRPLAHLYLVEWRAQGLLPPRDGLLLARG